MTTSTVQLLVMTEIWFDAWQVTVDGQPAKLLRAYGALGAVALPAEAREVKFEFHSPRYATGKVVTGATSFFLLALFGFHLVNYVRQRRDGRSRKIGY